MEKIKKNWILITTIIIMIILTIVMFFYIGKKEGFHEDEFFRIQHQMAVIQIFFFLMLKQIM